MDSEHHMRATLKNQVEFGRHSGDAVEIARVVVGLGARLPEEADTALGDIAKLNDAIEAGQEFNAVQLLAFVTASSLGTLVGLAYRIVAAIGVGSDDFERAIRRALAERVDTAAQ